MLHNDNTPTSTPQLKTCSKCGVAKPATPDYFHRSRDMEDGFNRRCKQCRAEAEGFGYKEPLPNGYKQCSACLQIKEATSDYFYCNRASKDGFQHRCKECTHAYAVTNAERRALVGREYREKNKENLSLQRRKHYQENRERQLQRHREYYRLNQERIRRNVGLWKKTNPEKVRVINRCREAREYDSNGTHTLEDVLAQYERQKGRCYYCHEKVGDTYHVDHIVPLSRGGSNDPENLVIACPSCNCSKQDKLPSEWPQGNRLL